MELKEYRLKMCELAQEEEEVKKEFSRRRRLLYAEYAHAHNPVKVGDIVTDHIGSVLVDSVKVYFQHSPDAKPTCIYEGVELTKKMVPRKDERRRFVFQVNLKSYETKETDNAA